MWFYTVHNHDNHYITLTVCFVEWDMINDTDW